MFGNDPDRPDVRPPRWATCGMCALCDKSGGIFGMMDDEMRDRLMAEFGLCSDTSGEPLLVELDAPVAEMACEGESWTLA